MKYTDIEKSLDTKLLKTVKEAIHEFRKERDRIDARIAALEALVAEREEEPKRASANKSRRLSAAGRAAISKAAKKRWAAYRRQQKQAAR